MSKYTFHEPFPPTGKALAPLRLCPPVFCSHNKANRRLAPPVREGTTKKKPDLPNDPTYLIGLLRYRIRLPTSFVS